jgi:hypothetical protein
MLSVISSPAIPSSSISSALPLPTLACDTYVTEHNELYSITFSPASKTHIATIGTDRIDALAHNPLDNYLYGAQHAAGDSAVRIIRIDSTGTATIISHIQNFGDITLGAIDSEGQYWVSNLPPDSAAGRYWVIDLNLESDRYTWTVQAGAVDTNGYSGIYDWAAAAIDDGGYLYTMASMDRI